MKRAAATEGEERPPFFLYYLLLAVAGQGRPFLMKLSPFDLCGDCGV